KGPLGFLQLPVSRTNFSTRIFATQLNLGMPVATVYFNSCKEPINRRRQQGVHVMVVAFFFLERMRLGISLRLDCFSPVYASLFARFPSSFTLRYGDMIQD
ncbi:hypothetical protein RJ639_047144, partial [Escallonia herrerae]